MLTEKQNLILEEMLYAVQNNKTLLLSSEQRRIGKTFTLNQLGLHLQSLGYKVYILTPHKNMEYYADRFISLSTKDYIGLLDDKVVIIADESRYIMMSDILDYCDIKNVPVVGYINYMKNRDVDNIPSFKREYECKWID